MPHTTLPIEAILPQLSRALAEHPNAVLVALPGSGKTTRVPLALLEEAWAADQRILMLEPRRLAARTAARYMASQLGERVGDTVGYRVRMDTQVGPRTRVEVITEGVLTRMLQDDPALDGVGLVIFDEFHERSLHADLGLALALESQSVLREDLKLLVMSATIDGDRVAALLGDCPVISGSGRSFPVETRYVGIRRQQPLEPQVAQAAAAALSETDGDVLVFLPGAGEIRRAAEHLARMGTNGARIAPLYGDMSPQAQDAAIAPSGPGERKVVLSTSIAETSITVEGIRVVIDSGLARVPRFSPRTGMTHLDTVPVSKASADQRRGRAGRVAPGVCVRLWTESEHRTLPEHSSPEIFEADLAPLALELALWGATDPSSLRWLDTPPAAAFKQARTLLEQLGAVFADGTVTEHGRRIAQLGLHPRLAHMVLTAHPLGLGELAAELAVLLSERDVLRPHGGANDADMRLRVERLRGTLRSAHVDASAFTSAPSTEASLLRRLQSDVRRILARIAPARPRAEGVGAEGVSDPTAGPNLDLDHDLDACGLLLAFAFPDRIAEKRSRGRFLLAMGRGAVFSQPQPLEDEPYLVAAHLDDQGTDSRILLAAPVGRDQLEHHFKDLITTEELVEWEPSSKVVKARRERRLGSLVLDVRPLERPDPERVASALLQAIRKHGLELLNWSKAAQHLRTRLAFMHRHRPEWPDVSDEALLDRLEQWLMPHLYGATGASGGSSRSDLDRVDVYAALVSQLKWEQQSELDRFAPTHLVVPSGSRIPIDYGDPGAPAVFVRLQEMFGLQATPRVGSGTVPLTLHLLSPAQRPVQVTQDLENFWRDTYFDVRKELKGRYPKHHWPDDPLSAQATNRTKRR